MTAPNPASFLTVAEAAKDIGLNPRTVMRFIRERRLPGVVLGSGKHTIYRIPREQWDDFKAGTWRPPVTPTAIATLHRKAS